MNMFVVVVVILVHLYYFVVWELDDDGGDIVVVDDLEFGTDGYLLLYSLPLELLCELWWAEDEA